MADRLGHKPIIIVGTVMTGASMLLFGFAGSYPAFIAASLVWGLASSVGAAAPAAYAADSAAPGMNAAAMSLYRMTADAGYVIGPLALGLMADAHGPIAALFASAALLVLSAFALVAPETYCSKAAMRVEGPRLGVLLSQLQIVGPLRVPWAVCLGAVCLGAACLGAACLGPAIRTSIHAQERGVVL